MNLDHHLDSIVARLRARSITGAAIYGNESFKGPAPELVDEVQQELEDVLRLVTAASRDNARRRIETAIFEVAEGEL